MKCVNPSTEEVTEFSDTPAAELPALYAKARERARTWARLSVGERIKALVPVTDGIEQQKEELARLIAAEMGKPIRLSRVEVDRTLEEFRYTLKRGAEWLAKEEAPHGYVRFDPLGVVAVISPWNFPLMLPLRGVVPALVAGNTVLLKPSELSLKTAKAFVSIFEKQIPDCPLFAAYGDKPLGAAVVELPVQVVAFTGSTDTGRKIAAASAGTLKRLVLELGGLDAGLVLDDADIPSAAKDLIRFNTANSGQVCSAVKRVYVSKAQYAAFVERAVEAAKALVVGDPLDEKTDLGPLVSETQLKRVQSFVDDARERGAKILCGGKRAARKGFFFEPTVIVDVPKDARLLSEEPFGPVLPILPFDGDAQAVELANSTQYGLTASVWSGDPARAEALAALIDVGSVSINAHIAPGPGAPWGGTKQSGFGRAKTKEGLREFTNTKFVRLP